jgi:hypothetical protein
MDIVKVRFTEWESVFVSTNSIAFRMYEGFLKKTIGVFMFLIIIDNYHLPDKACILYILISIFLKK